MKITLLPCNVTRHSRPRHGLANDLVVQRLARKVHGLGPRPMLELLAELAGDDPCMAEIIEDKLRRYAKLNCGVVRSLGGHDFAPVPLREVRR